MINYSASIKISQLNPETGSLISMADFLPIVNSGSLTTYRISLSSVQNAFFNTSSIGSDKNIIFQTGSALTASNNLNYNYSSSILFVSNSIQTPSITASLAGSASYAATSSFATSASYVASGFLTVATSASYVSGSNGVLGNLYFNVNGQKISTFYPTYTNTDSGLYFSSQTPTSSAHAEIYLAPSGSITSSLNDSINNVGLWMNGIYNGTTNPIPVYLGGNPSSNPPSATLTVLPNGFVGVGTMNPSSNLQVIGIINATGITSSLAGTSSWSSNSVNSLNSTISQTSSYINYIGQNTGTSSYAITSSFAQSASYVTPSGTTIKGFAMVTGSNAGSKTTDPLTVVTGYNIASVSPLGLLNVYSGSSFSQYCWGVTFVNAVSSSNYIVIGNGWEMTITTGSGHASVFLPQTASILNNRTTTAFTMSAQGGWAGTPNDLWGMNFQVIGH
jgi:hypothetical protein